MHVKSNSLEMKKIVWEGFRIAKPDCGCRDLKKLSQENPDLIRKKNCEKISREVEDLGDIFSCYAGSSE